MTNFVFFRNFFRIFGGETRDGGFFRIFFVFPGLRGFCILYHPREIPIQRHKKPLEQRNSTGMAAAEGVLFDIEARQ